MQIFFTAWCLMPLIFALFKGQLYFQTNVEMWAKPFSLSWLMSVLIVKGSLKLRDFSAMNRNNQVIPRFQEPNASEAFLTLCRAEQFGEVYLVLGLAWIKFAFSSRNRPLWEVASFPSSSASSQADCGMSGLDFDLTPYHNVEGLWV